MAYQQQLINIAYNVQNYDANDLTGVMNELLNDYFAGKRPGQWFSVVNNEIIAQNEMAKWAQLLQVKPLNAAMYTARD
jgi:hypothetical protein